MACKRLDLRRRRARRGRPPARHEHLQRNETHRGPGGMHPLPRQLLEAADEAAIVVVVAVVLGATAPLLSQHVTLAPLLTGPNDWSDARARIDPSSAMRTQAFRRGRASWGRTRWRTSACTRYAHQRFPHIEVQGHPSGDGHGHPTFRRGTRPGNGPSGSE